MCGGGGGGGGRGWGVGGWWCRGVGGGGNSLKMMITPVKVGRLTLTMMIISVTVRQLTHGNDNIDRSTDTRSQ